MLHETRHVAQVRGDRFRRCFVDEKLDLVVWYETDGTIHGFQLAYDPQDSPRIVTWTPGRGLFHASLDTGEDSPLANRSPVLRPCADYNPDQLLAAFLSATAELPDVERAFVEARLRESDAGH